LQEIIESIIPKNTSSNSFLNTETINTWIQNYKDLLSILNLEQITSLINLLGLLIILSSVILLIINFYSEYLIQYTKIENKYPKIAKIY